MGGASVVVIGLAHPWVLLLTPLPLLAWRLLSPASERGAVNVPKSVIAFLQRHSHAASPDISTSTEIILKSLVWFALVVALAGPISHRPALFEPTGRDIIVALDLSASMAEQDMRVNAAKTARIDVIRDQLARLLRTRSGDRVALIGFATEAYLIAPLTFDVHAVADMLNEAPIGLPGRKTDLGQAIGLAVKILRDEDAKGERLLILITDGEANAGKLAATDAAAMAGDIKLKIFAIGFTTDENIANQAHLKKLVAATGGQHFHASSAQAMEQAYATLASIAPIVIGDDGTRRQRDLRFPFLLIALGGVCVLFWREDRDP